jgi:uncharacterized protein
VPVLVLLPPSETKADGGDDSPLDLDRLSFPDLNPIRRKLADTLVELAADVPASITALGLSPNQATEVTRNAALWTTPTMPALRRYTGVLYDALDAKSFTRAALSKANARLAVASALFGVVRAADPIPAYRCSGGSTLPGTGTLAALWRPTLEPALTTVDDLIVDLRSGTYATLARLPNATVVRVVTEVGGRRTPVSHFNKAHKGRLARALATARTEPTTVTGLIRIARNAGLRIERSEANVLDLLS